MCRVIRKHISLLKEGTPAYIGAHPGFPFCLFLLSLAARGRAGNKNN